MRLYDRDFTGPASQEEKNALEAEYAFEQKPGIKRRGDAPRFSHPKTEIRDFLWHATSLFPNNHLNPIAVKYMNLEAEVTAFSSTLDAAQNEQSIQAYIKENRKWFIPASL